MCQVIISGNIGGVGKMRGIRVEQLKWFHTVVAHGREVDKVPKDIYVLQVEHSDDVFP